MPRVALYGCISAVCNRKVGVEFECSREGGFRRAGSGSVRPGELLQPAVTPPQPCPRGCISRVDLCACQIEVASEGYVLSRPLQRELVGPQIELIGIGGRRGIDSRHQARRAPRSPDQRSDNKLQDAAL